MFRRIIARLLAPIIDERVALYFRSVHDELVRAVESIESHRELLSNALDAHFSAVSQRTNEIMKLKASKTIGFRPAKELKQTL